MHANNVHYMQIHAACKQKYIQRYMSKNILVIIFKQEYRNARGGSLNSSASFLRGIESYHAANTKIISNTDCKYGYVQGGTSTGVAPITVIVSMGMC